ncbi:hypothetical protein [Mangrovihabitans endophyticus]|uniref:Exosortase/archaeosortase family protein n=1 Tax=Mangrovihabitans endophyticus TaxID=1751298 RepID=A0A8J3C3W6_9ACTN|nr:hypothetical protein [Mangrovihabitans endophyticus]GGL15070.1 hypothetical protein GCM10012284_57170 [Mangrovihabitans endophyticus]
MIRGLRRVVADAGPVRLTLMLAFAAAVAYAVAHDRALRHVEACGSAEVLRWFAFDDVSCVADTTLFRVDGTLTGYTITIGCTAIFLLFPFFTITGLLLLVRRVAVWRSLLAAVAATIAVLTVNQVRLLVIGAGMRIWGIEQGYAYTHIFFGTLVSTLGVVLSGFFYLKLLTGLRARKAVPAHA